MKVACLMMEKDEESLLETWIDYHGHLFGYESLFIFDNGSKSQRVSTILERGVLKGISLHKQFSERIHFYKKGEIISETIKFLQANSDFDFFIPLDCDEFVAVETTPGELQYNLSNILYEISKYRESESPLSIRGSYFNVPNESREYTFFPEMKVFFRSGNFESVDFGFHSGKTYSSSTPTSTNIVHLHFHNKPYAEAVLSAKSKLIGRIEDFSEESIRNYQGSGSHLLYVLSHSETEYSQRYPRSGIMLSEFEKKLISIGHVLPFSDYWNRRTGVDA